MKALVSIFLAPFVALGAVLGLILFATVGGALLAAQKIEEWK